MTKASLNEANLERVNIYLDTTVFKTANFHYDTVTFKQLIALAKRGKAVIHLTTITMCEVQAHIRRDVEKAVSAIRHSRKEARILRNIQDEKFYWLFQDVDVDKQYTAIYSLFTEFITQIQANFIPIQLADIEEVFRKYFASQPPFSAGEKKAEFPDAFVVQAILQWCERAGENMYIISGDGDMAAVGQEEEQLIVFAKLEEILNLFSLEDKDISAYAIAAFESLLDDIKDRTEKQFDWLGFILQDEEGDIDNVEADAVEILDKYLVMAGEMRAIFTVDVEVEFSADITYGDMANSFYDGEEGTYVHLEYITETIERTEQVVVEVQLAYELNKDPNTAQLISVEILQRDIDVYVHET
jgi:hypothetical protein